MDSVSDTIKTIYSSEDYSNDCDPVSGMASVTPDDSDHTRVDSEGFQYSDTFEDSIQSRPASSVRFSEDLEVISPKNPQRKHSSYSEDFESETDESHETYSEDFESEVKTPKTYTSYSSDTFEAISGLRKNLQYSESFEFYTNTNEENSSENTSEQTIDSVILSPR